MPLLVLSCLVLLILPRNNKKTEPNAVANFAQVVVAEIAERVLNVSCGNCMSKYFIMCLALYSFHG